MHARIDAIYRGRGKTGCETRGKLRRNGVREDGIYEMRYKKTRSGSHEHPHNLIR